MPRGQTPILYTSAESDGALSEIAFHWSQLTPVPSKPAALHRIRLRTKKTLRLAKADLIGLGVNWDRYAEIGYERTQAIGAAIAHLECDGLIAPSARWPCENVMVFMNNHVGDEDVAEVLDSKEIDWRSWANAHGFGD